MRKSTSGVGSSGRDQTLERIEVFCQCTLPAKRQLVPRDRFAIHELLARVEVTGLLQFAELSTEIAVGFVEQVAEPAERESPMPRQEYCGGHTRSVLQERIEAGQDVPPALHHPTRAWCHVRATNANRR
jgi:hypothetical protein